MRAGPLDTETDPTDWDSEDLETPPEDYGMAVLDQLKKIPAKTIRRGNVPWHDVLEEKYPKIKKEIDDAITAYHQGKLSNIPSELHLAKALLPTINERVSVKEGRVRDYIARMRNGRH